MTNWPDMHLPPINLYNAPRGKDVTLNQNINPQMINPRYVQLGKKEACAILGISIAELDRRRISDERCPNGFKERDDKMAPVKFRLSDIYTYSEAIMDSAIPLKGASAS